MLPIDNHAGVLASRLNRRLLALAVSAAWGCFAGSTVAQTNPGQPPAAVANETAIARSARLTHLAAEEFESALRALGGRLLQVAELPEGQVATYQVGTAGRGHVNVHVSRRTGNLSIQGPATLADSWLRLISTIDVPKSPDGRSATRLVALRRADPMAVRRVASIIEGATRELGAGTASASGNQSERRSNDLVSVFFQPKARGARSPQFVAQAEPKAKPDQPAVADQPGPAVPDQKAPDAKEAPAARGPGIIIPPGDFNLIGPVRIYYSEEYSAVVIIGDERDVEKVKQIIEYLDVQAETTQPTIVVHPLKHVGNEQLAILITTVYDQVLAVRQGRVSITALIKPNALLLIGRKENVDSVIELVNKIDQPVDPATQLETFQLKYASASAAVQVLREFFGSAVSFGQQQTVPPRTALGTRLHVAVDYRTNTLFVYASPRDMVEVRHMIEKLDTNKTPAVNQVRVVRLLNSVASEMAGIVQQAIAGPSMQPQLRPTQPGQPGQPQFQQQQQQIQQQGAGAASPQQQQQLQARSIMMQLLTVDERGRRSLSPAGLLNDVRITPATNANALIVSAPEESIDLVIMLIEMLDRLPPAEAQIKVFRVEYADATQLVQTLQSLFGQQQQQQQQFGPFGPFGIFGGNLATVQGAAQEGSTLIPLRFGIETRSNSVIVSGTTGDLAVVEALLLKLDDPEIRSRETSVYRLKNAPAIDVANAINSYLQSQRQVQQLVPGITSAFEQLEREVIVVPEPVSNSLIVSATPRFFKEIMTLVEKLDERPPMVMIQVLIAQVTLNETDEFGIEFGIQDSILFDRSVNGVPGFAFNNAPLGNNTTVPGSGIVGTQGLSHLAFGRTNPALGFGGLVLSASSESVNFLLRALQENRRVDVLSRPQVMTLDNQPAFIQVGARVPRITSSQLAANGATINNTTLDNVGLILGVTPRISPDGLVVMEIDAEKSELGPIDEGIPISIAPNGDVIRSPQINTTTAQTTVMAATGQTVILGGLITQSKSLLHRQVPLLGDIPLVGYLFRFDSEADERTELLIIMTPHVIRKEDDLAWLKQVESSRMSWCLADVYKLHGPGGPNGLGLASGGTPVVFPDLYPGSPEAIPTPTPATPMPATPTPATGPGVPPRGTMSPALEPPAPGITPPPPRSVSPPKLEPITPPPPRPGIQQGSSRRTFEPTPADEERNDTSPSGVRRADYYGEPAGGAVRASATRPLPPVR
jgi:type II secretion system protein D